MSVKKKISIIDIEFLLRNAISDSALKCPYYEISGLEPDYEKYPEY